MDAECATEAVLEGICDACGDPIRYVECDEWSHIYSDDPHDPRPKEGTIQVVAR